MIENFVTIGAECLDQKVTKVKPRMVGGNVNAHCYFFFRLLPGLFFWLVCAPVLIVV